MAAKKKTVRERLVSAFVEQLAARGWRHLSLNEVAGDAKLKRHDLYGIAAHRLDLPMLLSAEITTQMLADFEFVDDDSVRDRLFDILMARFDALQNYRAGIDALMESSRQDPALMLTLSGAATTAMEHVLAAALDRPLGPADLVRVTVLCAVYAQALKTWKDDDSADMAKTMAALDKRLAQIERIARRFS